MLTPSEERSSNVTIFYKPLKWNIVSKMKTYIIDDPQYRFSDKLFLVRAKDYQDAIYKVYDDNFEIRYDSKKGQVRVSLIKTEISDFYHENSKMKINWMIVRRSFLAQEHPDLLNQLNEHFSMWFVREKGAKK